MNLKLTLTQTTPEFIEWKWIEMNELPNVIVDFKKDVYKKILIKLKEFIN